MTEGTETDADTGSDDTTDVADSTETGADADGSADDSIPADSSDADGHISFADCDRRIHSPAYPKDPRGT